MAKRFLIVLTLGLLGTAGLVGCQAPSQAAYVSPAFGGPTLTAAHPAVVPLSPQPAVPVPPPHAMLAKVPARPAPPRVAANVPKGWVPPVPARPWRWIVIHHSDTETGGLAFIDRLHKARGWDGIGYDFVVGNGTDTGDGQVEIGYRWTQQSVGAHAKTPDNRFNEYGIGICLVGNMMDHPPTAKQMAAVERLTAYLMATYHIAPDHILGHGDTKATDCPGKYTNLALIRTVATRQAGGAAAYAAASYRRPAGEMLVRVAPPAR